MLKKKAVGGPTYSQVVILLIAQQWLKRWAWWTVQGCTKCGSGAYSQIQIWQTISCYAAGSASQSTILRQPISGQQVRRNLVAYNLAANLQMNSSQK
jgi:hypothetical protein